MAEATSPTFPQAVASFEPTSTRRARSGPASPAARPRPSWAIAAGPVDGRRRRAGRGRPRRPIVDHTITVSTSTGLEPATTYWYRFEAERRALARRADPDPPRPTARRPSASPPCAAPTTRSRRSASTAPSPSARSTSCSTSATTSTRTTGRAAAAGTTRRTWRRRSTTTGAASPRCGPIPTRRRSTCAIPWSRSGTTTTWRTTPGATAPRHHDPDEHGPWADRVAAAARARQEWLPGRLPDRHDPLTTWRSIAIGDLAELLLLDTRLQGRDRQAGDEESPDLDDPDRSLLGDEQRALAGRAAAPTSSRPWSVIASGVVVNEIELTWPRPLRWVNALLPNGYAILDGRVLHDDQWDGYPAERARLARELRAPGRAGWPHADPLRRRPLVLGVRRALRRRDRRAGGGGVHDPGGVVGRHGSRPPPGHVAAARPGGQRPRPRALGRGHRARATARSTSPATR